MLSLAVSATTPTYRKPDPPGAATRARTKGAHVARVPSRDCVVEYHLSGLFGFNRIRAQRGFFARFDELQKMNGLKGALVFGLGMGLAFAGVKAQCQLARVPTRCQALRNCSAGERRWSCTNGPQRKVGLIMLVSRLFEARLPYFGHRVDSSKPLRPPPALALGSSARTRSPPRSQRRRPPHRRTR
jgi:hypothetical protein